jgi:ABC-type uncharacterized transport system substrate-binding protein
MACIRRHSSRLIRARLLAGLAAVFATSWEAGAHPHVFIEHTVTLVFGDRGPSALRLTWIFDDMFSSTLKTTFVKGKPAALSRETVAAIEQRAFANLAAYGYFIELKINGAPLKVEKVANFDAMFAGTKAVYQFTVPIEAPVRPGANTLEFSVFDPEYYIDYKLARTRPFGVEKPDGLAVDCSVGRDVARDGGPWGTLGADVVTCSYRGRS